MAEWPKAADAWLKDLVEPKKSGTVSGCEVITTGARALVAVESLICRKLCYPSRLSEVGLVQTSSKIEKKVVYAGGGECLEDLYFNGPREAMAALNGLVMTGMRASAFFAGHRLAEINDLLFMTAGRHIPVVVHAICRAMPRQTTSSGSGHEGYHAVADSGIMMSMPRNHQQAVDLALVSRAASERALIPALVALDGQETAFSARDILFPDAEMVERFLGFSDTEIASPTPAQRIIFGERRPNLPRFYNLDRPTAQGASQGAHDFAASQAGQQPFVNEHLPAILQECLDEFKALTGRSLSQVSTFQLKDAKMVMIVQGSSVGTAEATAAYLRKTRGMKVGVLGITWLRPFPLDAIRKALKHAKVISVLERMDPALAQDPPLLREVRAAQAGQDARFVSVTYGLGGDLLSAAHLVAVCDNMRSGASGLERIHLGLDPITVKSEFPKREILLQEVRNEYPQLAKLAIPAGAPVDLRPRDAQTVTLYAQDHGQSDDLLIRLGKLMPGSHVRSRCSVPESGCWAGRVVCAGEPFSNPGDETPVDVVLIASVNMPAYINPITEVVAGGTVIIASERTPESLWNRLPDPWRASICEKNLKLYRVSGAAEDLVEKVDLLFKGQTSDLDIVDWASLPTLPAPEKIEREVPMIVRRRDQQEATYDNVSQFWSQVVQPRLEGESPRDIPDPGLTFGSIPAGSSTFNDRSGDRLRVPIFDAARCVGCGICWTGCPDSAIGPVAISSESLLDAAAARIEHPTAQSAVLKRLHRQLASRIDSHLAKEGTPLLTEETLDEACDWVIEKIPIADADRSAFREAFTEERRMFAPLPFAVTQPFFKDPHAVKKGTGSLLSMAFSAQACQGCGLCAEVCPDDAIHMEDQTAERVEDMREGWRAWERLPDTPGERIADMRKSPDMDPLAAILLSRHCLLTVAGGDAAEPGSGERIALRQVTAVVEHRMQKVVVKRAARFAELAQLLRERIRELLAESLSLEDLDALEASLSREGRRYAEISNLTAAMDEQGQTSRVDRKTAQRLTRFAQEAAIRHWQLTEGPTGLGRARFSLVVTADSVGEWAVKYPYNPFSVPLTVDPESDGIALGIIKGHLAEIVDQYRLIRRAEMALDPPRDHLLKEQALKTMTWKDLPDEELAACPPVLFIGGSGRFSNLDSLSRLLTSGLPVRIILLDGYEELSEYGDAALMAVALQNVFVLSTSIAHPDHLYDGIKTALTGRGPSLIRIYTPSPRRHGYLTQNTMERAREAVNGRVHMLFRCEPSPEGIRLHLDENPMSDQPWSRDAAGNLFTPAHWALGERRFAGAFIPADEADANATLPLGEWLALTRAARREKIPIMVDADGNRWALQPMLIRALENREALWKSLQDLAHSVRSGDAGLPAHVLEESEQAHREEVASLKQEYEEKLRALEAGQVEAQSRLLRERLLHLSGMATRKKDAADGGEA